MLEAAEDSEDLPRSLSEGQPRGTGIVSTGLRGSASLGFPFSSTGSMSAGALTTEEPSQRSGRGTWGTFHELGVALGSCAHGDRQHIPGEGTASELGPCAVGG